MKLPGEAWLQFRIVPKSENESVLVQTAVFEPLGLLGLLLLVCLIAVARPHLFGFVQCHRRPSGRDEGSQKFGANRS